jgi:ATP-dependent Clp protease ATP-binding subunit ClpC
MNFIAWHYTQGIRIYLDLWISQIDWAGHQFSPFLLLKTLFSPWKRLHFSYQQTGFSFRKYLDIITFNFVSRFIGAFVRLVLFFIGIFFIFLIIVVGLIGFVLFVIVPFFSLNWYERYQHQPKILVKDIVDKAKRNPKVTIKTIFNSVPGKFVITHMGTDLDSIIANAKFDERIVNGLPDESYGKLLEVLAEKELFDNDFYRKLKIKKTDFVQCGYWWDDISIYENDISGTIPHSAGFAMELVYGYTPTLDKYSVNLATPQDFTERLVGREEVVTRMERVLSRDRNILLIGTPGVGKRTVVLEFAKRAVNGEMGKDMVYKRLLEFDYNALLAGFTDTSEKKTELAKVLREAANAGNVILMVRDIHRLTNKDVEGLDFTDVFEESIEKGHLKIIAVSTEKDYERFTAQNVKVKKYFETVEVTPPEKEESITILMETATMMENKYSVLIPVQVLRLVLDESDRYITETPFPEKALELLDAVVVYAKGKGKTSVEIDDVHKVLAEKTGVSFDALTEKEKIKLSNLEDIIHERLINQDVAVRLIAKTLRAKTVGVIKEERPLGSFLFLGPTGVGKTETAKVLAKSYYGSTEAILRYDMAEYAGREGLERLIGTLDKNMPGVLTTAIKNKPASLLLLDEVEKASPEIFNLFLTLLDEGYLRDVFNNKVSGRHLFIIATSNAGSEYIRQLVDRGVAGDDLQKSVLDHVLKEGLFSPEFLNRFDGVVVFEPLKPEYLTKIAKLIVSDLEENLKAKGVKVRLSDGAIEKLATDGYEPAFGARPMKRIVNLEIGDILGKAVIKEEIQEGDKITIDVENGKFIVSKN